MNKYIRTTHNFNNKTREWEYRGDIGGDKYNAWKRESLNDEPYWSLGVHVLELDRWMTLDAIVSETIKALQQGAADYDGQISIQRLIEDHPTTYREIITKDVLKNLNHLIKRDMVRIKKY